VKKFVLLAFFAAARLGVPVASAEPAWLIVGQDEKVTFDAAGKIVALPPGKDVVSLIDYGSDPERPRLVVNLPLANSLFGPPTNVAISPDERFALVADAMAWNKDGEAWKPGPGELLSVIDLRLDPPRVSDSLKVGRQPSGVAICPCGSYALVALRADKAIAVLGIKNGVTVSLRETIPLDDEVTAVAISPDGKTVLATKNTAHKVAVLRWIDGKLRYDKSQDLPAGVFPFAVEITPDGTLGLVVDMGNGGRPDGSVDTISVIDLAAEPPRVIDRVVVGDAPEAFAISPRGDFAVTALIGGSILAQSHWAHTQPGKLVTLSIAGKEVRRVGEITVGGLPEGLAFSPDGNYLYATNLTERYLAVYRVNGTELTEIGERLLLPGRPASTRGRAR
jgi:DNA-binding beta-propeller fold protein YncE